MDLDVHIVTRLQPRQLHQGGVEDQALRITEFDDFFVHG
jgi:hypothetical protein